MKFFHLNIDLTNVHFKVTAFKIFEFINEMKIQSISFNVLKEMSKDFKMKKEWSNKKRQYERVVTIKPY